MIGFCGFVFAKFLCVRLNFCGYLFARKIQFVYTQQSSQVGIQREKISIWHTILRHAKSSVLYLCSVGGEKDVCHLYMTADFSSAQSRQINSGKNRKNCFSDCSEKEQTVYINPRRSGRKTLASTTQKLRVCSQNKTLSN